MLRIWVGVAALRGCSVAVCALAAYTGWSILQRLVCKPSRQSVITCHEQHLCGMGVRSGRALAARVTNEQVTWLWLFGTVVDVAFMKAKI